MSRFPPISEAAMQAGEACIPELASEAGRAAHQLALVQTGAVVMRLATGQLVEMKASGAFRVLKVLPAGTPVRPGTVLKRAKKSSQTSHNKT